MYHIGNKTKNSARISRKENDSTTRGNHSKDTKCKEQQHERLYLGRDRDNQGNNDEDNGVCDSSATFAADYDNNNSNNNDNEVHAQPVQVQVQVQVQVHVFQQNDDNKVTSNETQNNTDNKVTFSVT